MRFLEMFEKFIFLKQEISGDDNHPRFLPTYTNIASLYMSIGRHILQGYNQSLVKIENDLFLCGNDT